MSEQDEQSDFDRFAEQALRGPRKGVYEHVVAGLLIKANSCSDPLKKVRTLCEAAISVKDKDKLNMDTVEVAFTVSSIFLEVELEPEQVCVMIPWSFPLTLENWRKYIVPWHTIDLHYFPYHTNLRKSKYPEVPIFDRFGCLERYYDAQELYETKTKVTNLIHEAVSNLPEHEKFFEMTTALSRESFFALRTEFENWAISQLLTVQNAIAEQINPSIFAEVFKTMAGQTEEVENEGSMGPRE
jgi:hypothetical protein